MPPCRDQVAKEGEHHELAERHHFSGGEHYTTSLPSLGDGNHLDVPDVLLERWLNMVRPDDENLAERILTDQRSSTGLQRRRQVPARKRPTDLALNESLPLEPRTALELP